MKSDAATPQAYLDALPPERRAVVSAVRQLVNEHIPAGYREGMAWGMIGWDVPLERYPDTYNKQPLAYAGLAAQKNHYALYLHGCYMSPGAQEALQRAYVAAGKKLDMGKSCLRFKKLEDLVPEAVAAAVAALGVDDFIATYEAAQKRR
ncbi:MAG TPA: DUF1801 domain-containing protein [Longimicrobiales bacterium]|nr:DUF1801 domain-containing protein [Longimicrobiales bacterium]